VQIWNALNILKSGAADPDSHSMRTIMMMAVAIMPMRSSVVLPLMFWQIRARIN